MRTLVVLLLVGCGAAQPVRRPVDGAIAGLVRDAASGEPIALAALHLVGADRERVGRSNPDGTYAFDHLAPGRYTLRATFAGQPVTIENIDVPVGEAMFVDITFTLGKPEPLLVDYGDHTQGRIERFRSERGARIEGTVNDSGSRVRVIGAVVTATLGIDNALQTVTDDHGRYRFDDVLPGTYAVSAYYSIGGRGQIEVRRADIHVEPSEGVFVPLWVELARP